MVTQVGRLVSKGAVYVFGIDHEDATYVFNCFYHIADIDEIINEN